MIFKLNSKIIPYSKEIQKLCRNPYYQHPMGCPNYDKKESCPPNQPLIDMVLDFSKPLYIIYTEFDIGEHAEKMLEKHQEWSERQAYCCLYWQPKAKKIQRIEETKAVKEYGVTKIVNSPEAYGVDVTGLMENIGVILEWPPRKITRLVSLGGYSRY